MERDIDVKVKYSSWLLHAPYWNQAPNSDQESNLQLFSVGETSNWAMMAGYIRHLKKN